MATDRGKLGNFLKEVIEWRWDDFCRAETDSKYTGIQAAVFALVRTCSEAKLGAIRLAIDRVDGKLETPVKMEYPKIWLLFPEATSVAELPEGETAPPELPSPETLPEVIPELEPEEPKNVATLTLRQTVEKMAEYTKDVVPLILAVKRKVEMQVKAGEAVEDGEMVDAKVPLVKSVIAANLLYLAIERNNFEAITEVFDQIDGKLVETIRVLGDDLFLTQYSLVAPYGAVKNKNGVYMIEAKEATAKWKQKLKKD